MKILFCNTSWMKYFNGANRLDPPLNGGSYVHENGYGHEQYNFQPVTFDDGRDYCLGFVETKTTHSNRNQLHIERIDGCSGMEKEEYVDDVLVVWCATRDINEPRVMGWYKGATVYRNYREACIDGEYIQEYNIIAPAEKCVLLPVDDRNEYKWSVPYARKRSYGFGQAMIWYAEEKMAENYIIGLVKEIEQYSGPNQMYTIPMEFFEAFD